MMLLTGSRRRAGFTLLELLLVIVIIAVLLGINLPLIKNNIEGVSFKSFVNKVYLFLDYAATQSILKTVIIKAWLDVKENKLFLAQIDNEGEALFSLPLPGDVSVEFDNEEIVFYPDGTSREFKIIISGGDERSFTISSAGFDGKINIDEDSRD